MKVLVASALIFAVVAAAYAQPSDRSPRESSDQSAISPCKYGGDACTEFSNLPPPGSNSGGLDLKGGIDIQSVAPREFHGILDGVHF
jgi:hypothetical protein